MLIGVVVLLIAVGRGLSAPAGPANEAATPGATIARPQLLLDVPARTLPGHVVVRRVIDGDTLELAGGERVRLIGVNTAELGRHRVDPAGDGWRATMFVHDLLQENPQVRLEHDAELRDRYGRTLAYLYLPDGSMLNERLLAEGWADTMTIAPNTLHARRFAVLRDRARAAGRGIWAR